jgi:hypothetical protein
MPIHLRAGRLGDLIARREQLAHVYRSVRVTLRKRAGDAMPALGFTSSCGKENGR